MMSEQIEVTAFGDTERKWITGGPVLGTATYFGDFIGGTVAYSGKSSPDQSYAYSATKRCDYCQRKNAHDKAVCDGCGAVL